MTEEEERAYCVAWLTRQKHRAMMRTGDPVQDLMELRQYAFAEGWQGGAMSGLPTLRRKLKEAEAKLARVEATIDDAHLDGYETRQAIRVALEDKP